MPVGLIHLIPDVSTGLILVAFVCALIAWIAFKKMRARERLLRTMLRSERFKAPLKFVSVASKIVGRPFWAAYARYSYRLSSSTRSTGVRPPLHRPYGRSPIGHFLQGQPLMAVHRPARNGRRE
jgi:hypothetical protein